MIAEAAKAANSLDPTVVAEEIKKHGTFNTVLGDRSFNEKGDTTNPDYVVYRWKKGTDGKYNYSQL